MVRTIAACVLTVAVAAALPAAPSHARNKANQVRALYVAPKDPAHEAIHRRLKEAQALERLSRILGPLRLPRRLTLKVEGCDGQVNAFYQDDVVTVCYEYLEFVDRSAPPWLGETSAARKIALVGPTVDVFLHEVGHAVFDMLEIPVLGREEDAADLFSAYLMLQAGPEDARKLIIGVAFLGAKEAMAAQKESPSLKAFADEHGLPAQRYFNVLCMAYGADSKAFAEAITIGQLPAERAEGCEAEYQQFDHAFRKLILPHVNRRLLRRVRAQRWLGF
jgi:hypothetical protein